MGEREVLAALGEPTRRTESEGTRSPEWQYATGLGVIFSGEQPRVAELYVTAPFSGRTQEGFALAATRQDFRRTYAALRLTESGPTSGGVTRIKATDAVGTSVLASFGVDDRATLIQLFAF
jgi:hypothetical protein